MTVAVLLAFAVVCYWLAVYAETRSQRRRHGLMLRRMRREKEER